MPPITLSRCAHAALGAFLLICLAAANCVPAQHVAAEWLPLPLPEGTAVIEAAETAPTGELFIASSKAVFIRSPFGGTDGWEEVPVRIPDGQAFKDLAVTEGPDGAVLLVLSDRLVQAVRWEYDIGPARIWEALRYKYQVETIASADQHDFTRIVPSPPQTLNTSTMVRAWVQSDRGFHGLLIREGAWSWTPLQNISAGSVIGMTPLGGGGWGGAWNDGSATYHALDSMGMLVNQTWDLSALFEDVVARERIHVHCAWLDEQRDLLFIGTSHGLVVGDVEPGTAMPANKLSRVVSVTGPVVGIGSTVGRMWIALGTSTDAPGGLFFEPPSHSELGPEEAQSLEFVATPGAGGPDQISFCFALDDDLVLACGTDQYWEWSPGQWRPVLLRSKTVEAQRVKDITQAARAPTVLLLEGATELLYRRPDRPDGWIAHRSTQQDRGSTRVIHQLIPDPSGLGVWSCTRDGFALETPHGSWSGRARGTGSGIQVDRYSVDRPNGKSWWPWSQAGGVLCPSMAGGEWVYLVAGAQHRVAETGPAGTEYVSLLPGAESSDSAWLGIERRPGKAARVVRIDVESNDEGSFELVVDPISWLLPDRHRAQLFPDTTGQVWCAFRSSETIGTNTLWQAVRILSYSEEPTKPQNLALLPDSEQPWLLWLNPSTNIFDPEPLLFTQRGCVAVPRDGEPWWQQKAQAEWIQLFEPRSSEVEPWSTVRTVRIPSAWLPAASIGKQMLLLTDLHTSSHAMIPSGTGAKGLGYELNLAEPSQPLRIYRRQTGAANRIVHWARSYLDDTDFVFWGRAASGMKAASRFEFFSDGVQARTHTISTVADWSFACSIASEPRNGWPAIDFSATDHVHVAFHRGNDQNSWGRSWLPYVASQIELESGDGSSETIDLAIEGCPKSIGPDVHSLLIAVSPAYEFWWGEDPSWVSLHEAHSDNRVRFDDRGRARTKVMPGADYSFALALSDPLATESIELLPWPVRTEPSPPAALSVWLWGSNLFFISFGFGVLLPHPSETPAP